MIAISTPHAPAPAGHYSQAIVHNGIVYVAGQLAVDPATGEKRLGTIEEQTEQLNLFDQSPQTVYHQPWEWLSPGGLPGLQNRWRAPRRWPLWVRPPSTPAD